MKTRWAAAATSAALFAVMLGALTSASPVAAQTEISTLASLTAFAGDDPRATYARLRIPAIGVDAAVGAHEVAEGGVMPNPYGPGDVAWYDFAQPVFGGEPGSGRNTVMSGHVNYNAYLSYAGVRYRGLGIFARLDELEAGDHIEVVRGGKTYRYMVSWRQLFAADANNRWGTALSSLVPTDSITLFTCDGTFDGRNLSYSHRLVVRAERVDGTPNRIPYLARVTSGVTQTNHPVALARAQDYPVKTIYAQDSSGRWLTYTPGAPSFTNTLLGNLKIGAPVFIVSDGPRR
jgi:sortase (surface protein transpeptidase)